MSNGGLGGTKNDGTHVPGDVFVRGTRIGNVRDAMAEWRKLAYAAYRKLATGTDAGS